MTLQAIYERFLNSPSQSDLSEQASFTYVPTLTTIKEAEAIAKHLERQNKSIVKTKGQKILSTIEGQGAVALDVETTLEFVSGGGAYLPGLDTFINDQVAVFPATHIVVFDENQKIKQVRISWDQGALLKQVGIIGSSGRNWPIRDGKDQARLIAGASVGTLLDSKSVRGREALEQATLVTRTASPAKRMVGNPYGELSKTGLGPPPEGETTAPLPTPIAPKRSAKPPERDLGELFVGDDESAPSARPESAKKESPRPAPKGAVGYRNQGSRIFDESPDDTPVARYKSDPNKYSHFDIGNDEEPELEHVEKPKQARPNSQRPISMLNVSQWQFEDFVTPSKPKPRARANDLRHDEWFDQDNTMAGSPGKNPHIPHARPDSVSQFTLEDSTPAAAEKVRPISHYGHNNRDFYRTELGEEQDEPVETKRPLSTVTNIASRKKDFDASWMDDESPTQSNNNENKPQKPAQGINRQSRSMNPSWAFGNDSPESTATENRKPSVRRRAEDERHWGFGDDQGVEQKQTNQQSAAAGKSFWDF